MELGFSVLALLLLAVLGDVRPQPVSIETTPLPPSAVDGYSLHCPATTALEQDLAQNVIWTVITVIVAAACVFSKKFHRTCRRIR